MSRTGPAPGNPATPSAARRPRVVHLPVYDNNPYQPTLLAELRRLGFDAIDGGGGGRYTRTALQRWRGAILHFHWLHPYIWRDTPWQTTLRGRWLTLETRLLQSLGCPVVWTVHNLVNHEQRDADAEVRAATAMARISDLVLVHSQTARDRACELYRIEDAAKMHVWPHPSYIGCYPDEVTREDARQQLGFAGHQTVYLCFGRVEAYKGLDDLLRYFVSLDDPDCVLLIAGNPSDPSDAEALEALRGNDQRVRLDLRFIPDEQVQTYFRAADLVLLPFRNILTSGSVRLAQTFGKPCLTFDVGELREVLGAEQLVESFEQMFDRRYRDADRLGRIGAANRNAAESWTFAKAAEDLAERYRVLLEGR